MIIYTIIATAISILGIPSMVYTLISFINKKRLNAKILSINRYENRLTIDIAIINKSELRLSINDLKLFS